MEQWKHIAPVLAESYRIVSIDPRGVGRSDNPRARYSDAHDILRLQDHLDLPRVGLIGVSSSGGLALEYALLHPDRVAGVVGSAPFVVGFEFSDEMRGRLAAIAEAARSGAEAFLDFMLADPHFIPSPLDPSIRDAVRNNMRRNFHKSAGFDSSLAIALQPPTIERLGEFEVPILVVGGALDHPDVLRRNRFLAEQIPTAEETLVADAGHNIPQENPEGFLDAIGPFLKRLQ